ncbi:hypothetical protein AWZ03_013112 [Drosophila navojoa]|uniref:Uncharacterized protein n=1 Tax=Drosophila navojoa TaxID=7232 RepID=A0A484AVN8_DRONA|nr:hypothetical protein AWZ03_013112 [Drosophila navojoa]
MSQELTSHVTNPMDTMEDTSKVEVIVYTKSDKTLKQNMNAKDDTLRKRTSLIIVPQQVDDLLDVAAVQQQHQQQEQQQQQQHQHQQEQQQLQLTENGNRNSIASMDSCVSTNTSQSNQSSVSSSSSTSSEDAHAAYQDLQNGNGADELGAMHSPGCSSTSESTSCSSSVDYSLREQLHNYANRSEEQLKCINHHELLKGMSLPMEQAASGAPAVHCDALLSPQEVPLGRRYAEVAQFKGHSKARCRCSIVNARSNEQQLTTAAAAVGVAGPLTDKTEAVVAAVKCSNNGNNNNNSNGNGNGSSCNNAAQQSQKSQLQQSSNNNSNKLNGQSNLSSNNNNNNSSSNSNSNNNNNNNNKMTCNSQTDGKNGDSRRSSSLEPDADDVVDLAHGGAFDDDMQALLPKCTRRSRDELSQPHLLLWLPQPSNSPEAEPHPHSSCHSKWQLRKLPMGHQQPLAV